MKQVRSHQWFKGVNFNKILSKSIKVPYYPELKDKADLKYFENNLKNESK